MPLVFVLLIILAISGVGCRNQYSSFQDFQVAELILCEGLDAEGNPIRITKTVFSDIKTVSVCANIETEHEYFFSVHWRGPHFSKRTLLTVEQNGWIVTQVNHSDHFLPGEYRVSISFGRIPNKASLTFEVVDKAQ